MSKASIPWILHWWVSPKLPKEHIFISPENQPKGFYNIFRIYFRKWFVHPIKRRLAKYYLVFLKKFFGLKVVAVTGSVGKTTTKEMIASVLSQKYKTVSSLANIDPVYNIPATILRATPKTKMLVLEMGIEFPGEMDFYLWLAQPDVGVLTSIYWTHTQFLKDIEGVAKEKGNLVEAIPKNGWAILNADDERVKGLSSKTKAKVLLYGIARISKVRAQSIKLTPDFKTEFTLKQANSSKKIRLPILGEHFVWAALAAVAAGRTQKVPIEKIKRGLENFEPQPHRMVPIEAKNGAILLDDTYNSSPLGAKSAIDTLTSIGKDKKTIAVLGDMLELGNYERKGHKEVGNWAAQRGVSMLVCVGNLAKHIAEGAAEAGMSKNKIIWLSTVEEAKKYLKNLISHKTVVLFKASRVLALEQLVYACQNIR